MPYGAIVFALLSVLLVVVVWRGRKRPRLRPGPGAAGTVYDLLNEDRRKAVEIILEERAEARDPEHRDGNLPDLEHPRNH